MVTRMHVHLRGNLMARTLEELEAIVRERICRVCTDRTVNGDCGLEEPSSCALFRLFPQVARAVQSVSSDDIRDYNSGDPRAGLFGLLRADFRWRVRVAKTGAMRPGRLPFADHRCHRGVNWQNLRPSRGGDITQAGVIAVGDITPSRALESSIPGKHSPSSLARRLRN
jgi:hypothetical protein